MKFLVVLTPPSVYHGCSTRKTFLEEKLTGKKDLFQFMNMKICGRRKVRKNKESKGSDKIFTLNVSANFDSLNNIFVFNSGHRNQVTCSLLGGFFQAQSRGYPVTRLWPM